MCQAFPTTLKGSTWVWFNKLKPSSIETFAELSKGFVSHFITGQRHRRLATHLLTVKQQKGEPLLEYINRFNTKMLQMDEADDKVALTSFMGGLHTFRFLFSLSKEPPTSMAELLVRARKHMNTEDVMSARKRKEGEDKKADKKRPQPGAKDEKETKFKKSSINQSERASHYKSSDKYTNYTPLTMSIDQVLMQIQDDPSLKCPSKLKSEPSRRPRDKYCRFHRDHGHITEDCIDLKDQIENLIRRGHLRRFIAGDDRRGTNLAQGRRDNHPPKQQPVGEIRVISGVYARGGETATTRKTYVRRARTEVNEVGMFNSPSKTLRYADTTIMFSEADAKGIQQPHDDPLVVSMVVANYTIRRILIVMGIQLI
ncbi:uncharacterized protein LOC132280953 [Cornus florida]|uniref:uncharacterized protein LOC132280953 n=1 Tax=Cornus florida TaxID=4283 RepID=UPI0028992148|nr:uncharacterized protein LOC132280953 [Cornus florida]